MPRPTGKFMAPYYKEVGRIPDGRVSEARVVQRFFRCTVLHPDRGGQDGLPSVVWSMPRGDNAFSLTALTATELRAAKLVFEMAFELAEPICEALDKVAEEAWERGDDTHSRSYRSLPVFFVREGILQANYTGIPLGPNWLAELAERYGQRAEGMARIRGRNSRVLDDEPGELEAEDDTTAGGHVQELRQPPPEDDPR